MVSERKIALIAAIAAVGMATPALADGASGSQNFGAAPAAQSRQSVVHARKLYNSATVPNYDAQSYQSSNYNDWANDAEWSTTGRQNSGH
jgi:hypothetical protein